MSTPKRGRRTPWWTIAGGIVVILAISGAILNPRLTRYVEGPEFQAELEKQTAKGLHFPSSEFAPIKRTGLLSAATDSFQAADGRKAMTSFDTHGISARFNPLGVFLRRWQLDELHIDRGEVGIQIYEPKPEPSPSKPWYHVFLPDRVHLKRVWSENADITWQLGGEKGGIFSTKLEITPHGRDFNYQATGGVMKNPLMPDLPLRETRMLITKELFTLHTLDLRSGDGTIHGEGSAETRGAKKIDFKLDWKDVPLREWMPKNWNARFVGKVTGDLHWTGRDFKIETANMQGALRINGGRLSDASFLQQLAAITKRDDFARLEFNECRADFALENGEAELKKIAIEDKGKFRLEGNVSIKKESLGGTLQLGVSRVHLTWLPKPEEVFPRERDGYLWTTVRLSGTLDAPQQDLSPRLLDALDDSPSAFFGAALRAFGAWLRGK